MEKTENTNQKKTTNEMKNRLTEIELEFNDYIKLNDYNNVELYYTKKNYLLL